MRYLEAQGSNNHQSERASVKCNHLTHCQLFLSGSMTRTWCRPVAWSRYWLHSCPAGRRWCGTPQRPCGIQIDMRESDAAGVRCSSVFWKSKLSAVKHVWGSRRMSHAWKCRVQQETCTMGTGGEHRRGALMVDPHENDIMWLIGQLSGRRLTVLLRSTGVHADPEPTPRHPLLRELLLASGSRLRCVTVPVRHPRA